MTKAKANNIELEYDTIGDPSSEPLLLINAGGDQLIHWDKIFCNMLVEKGFYVIRFDNRDVGLSTKFEHLGIPNMSETIQAYIQGKEIPFSYTLDDMADDTIGLMDALGIDKAHFCGMSLGGAIAQTIGFRHPDRVLSLVMIMISTGNLALHQPSQEVMNYLLKPIPTERDAYVKFWIDGSRIGHGSGFPFDENKYRELHTQSFDRSFYPHGWDRQTIAVMVTGDLKPKLGAVKAPTMVIHGADDPVVPLSGGKDLAASIPGAELLIIDGMGHTITIPETWPRIVDAIRKNADKASSSI